MQDYNISIIVMDTLRNDTFSEIFQKQGLAHDNFFLYDKCIAPAPWTLPSHASLLSGMYPSSHGAHETKKVKSLNIEQIKLKHKTIVSYLKQNGYNTSCISANPYVHPIYGFDEFNFFYEESYFTDIFGSVIEISDELKPKISEYRNKFGNNIIELSKAIIKEDPNLFIDVFFSSAARTPRAAAKKIKAKFIDGWPLEKGGSKIVKKIKDMDFDKKSFLFVNLMEAHDPYIGKKNMDFNWSTPFKDKPIDPDLIKIWKKIYLKGSMLSYNYANSITKNLLDRYGEDQIIILVSDHGQALGENGFVGHGTVLDDEVIRVPLAIYAPRKIKQKKIEGYQSLVNIPEFIKFALIGSANASTKLTSKKVISESFSIPANLYSTPGINMKKVARYDKKITRIFE